MKNHWDISACTVHKRDICLRTGFVRRQVGVNHVSWDESYEAIYPTNDYESTAATGTAAQKRISENPLPGSGTARVNGTECRKFRAVPVTVTAYIPGVPRLFASPAFGISDSRTNGLEPQQRTETTAVVTFATKNKLKSTIRSNSPEPQLLHPSVYLPDRNPELIPIPVWA